MSRNKWKAVDLSLQFSIKADWSQEDVDTPLSDIKSIRSTLPTKTNATRQNAELDNIPENGPFILNYANIPFESSESDLRSFFRVFDVCDIEVNYPRPGCGRITFTNLNDLAGAWKLNEKMFLSRPIRLSIPLKEDIARQQAMNTKPRYQSQQKPSTFNSEDSDNWRARGPKKETSDAIKEGESSNWRSQTTRSQESAVETNSESSNWRTRTQNEIKPVDSAWRTKSSVTTDKPDVWRSRETATRSVNVDNNPNWRTQCDKRESKTDSKIDECDNWRRGQGNSERLQPREENRVTTDKVHEVSAYSKKLSVFGDARPVDTTVKDLEIEAKIEQKKITSVNTISKPNAWATPKSSAVPPNVEKSSMPEWRVKRTVTPVNRSRTTSDNQKSSLTDHEQSIPEKIEKKPQLAPPPAVNVWAERMKSRGAGNVKGNLVGETKDGQGVVGVDKHIADVGVRQRAEGTGGQEGNSKAADDVVIDPGTSNYNDIVTENDHQETTSLVKSSSVESKTVSRHPVVISVNGPYLDPKKNRTSQPHTASDNCKTPTAVPITKSHSTVANAVTSAHLVRDSGSMQTPNNPGISEPRLANVHNSWSRGPPKALLEMPTTGTVSGVIKNKHP